ncbi:MAG: glycosyltransferase family 4 protein [Opitutales bacterium]
MKITIVQGFFLPMPPVAGGAMEKAWWSLARIFAARGHEVVSISRTWSDWSDDEHLDGIHCRRIPGYAHTASLPRNLLLDACWGWRVLRHLPRADILVTNTVLLPALAPWLRPSAGRVVVNLNRMPKGQLRVYRRIARVQVPSAAVAAAVATQSPRLVPITRIFPNPVDLSVFPAVPPDQSGTRSPVRIGYIGRLHPEKGLDLLIEAARLLLNDTSLPAWTLTLRGPADIPRGGGGDAYVARLKEQARPLAAAGRFSLEPPEFDATVLARHYADLDIFAYPSLAEIGETFGVAVAEAMAAGAVPIVSDLPCFQDLVTPGKDGLVFSRGDPAAAAQLAIGLAELIQRPDHRRQLAQTARRRSEALGLEPVAETMLADFNSLLP